MPFHVALGVQVSEACVRPFHGENAVCPAFLKYHWYLSSTPVAFSDRVSDSPCAMVWLLGWGVIFSSAFNVTVAAAEFTLAPLESVTLQ